ncbi:hypothetical protein [Butyrivibrio sp. AE3004]|jgi:hypothetical protein|uniref:hypothetical protein n=1 Tax=Butyrivibrio sp. AE3004 TaxID=1506994 RepID=UPI0004941F04|nr:hypothetical protein [Butyrivibrio sp. AE3004]
MNQAEALKELQSNEQQAKQFNMVAAFMNEAVRNNMPVFMKLVQFDVLKAIQEKAVEDKVAGENTSEKQLTEALDSLLGQINKDLEAQIIKKFEELKK